MRRAAADLERLQPVGMLHEQVAEVGRRAVGGGDGQQHPAIVASGLSVGQAVLPGVQSGLWRRCRPCTGTGWLTAGCSVTSARGRAGCTRGSAGFCFVRERGRRRDRAHHVWPLVRVLRRPDREEAAQPLPARLAGAVVRHRRLQPGCRFCQNWDISKRREIDTLADAAAPGAARRGRRERLGCRVVAFTYNDPVIFMEYAMDVADACRAARDQDGRGDRRIHEPRAARGVLPAHRRREHRPEGVHREVLREGARSPAWTRCWPHWTTCGTRPTCGWRSRRCSSPARTTRDDEMRRQCDWLLEHLGTDVPLHFTAFHPDFKMRDIPPTPPATLARARADRAGRRPAVRLHRQRPRPRRPDHALPGLRRAGHRPRLVRPARLPPDRRRPLRPLWTRSCPACSTDRPATWGRRRLPVVLR